MSSEPDIGAFLLGDSAVTDLCGQQVYKLRLPQQAPGVNAIWPAVCWFRVGGTRTETFCSADDLVQGQYQVDAYSDDPDAPEALARAIRRRLVDYMGPMGGARINRIFVANDYDFGPEFEPGIYRRTTTYTIFYLES